VGIIGDMGVIALTLKAGLCCALQIRPLDCSYPVGTQEIPYWLREARGRDGEVERYSSFQASGRKAIPSVHEASKEKLTYLGVGLSRLHPGYSKF
jgi:hypothetical protein